MERHRRMKLPDCPSFMVLQKHCGPIGKIIFRRDSISGGSTVLFYRVQPTGLIILKTFSFTGISSAMQTASCVFPTRFAADHPSTEIAMPGSCILPVSAVVGNVVVKPLTVVLRYSTLYFIIQHIFHTNNNEGHLPDWGSTLRRFWKGCKTVWVPCCTQS